MEQDILFAALELPEHERDAFVAHACGDSLKLRERLSKLLRVAELSGSFMTKPVFGMASPPQDQKEPAQGPGESMGADLSTTLELQRDYAVGDSIGRYKLLELIGEGGMGVVYMASQRQPIRRVVALKLIKPGMDSRQVVARFSAERQALALMNHPHIAKVLDAGTTDTGRPYFVMDLVRGIPITAFCDLHKLNLRERLELFARVCDAVHHAHQKGVIHRDLKPSNILVELEDVRAVPKIIDFGVAKATHQSLDNTMYTGFSQFIGTPLYMSPEQASLNSLDVDTRSDIYSLGVVLYEILTGSTPFDQATLKEAGFDGMRRIICEQEPRRPSQHVSTLNAEIKSTVSSLRRIDPRQLSLSMKRELDWIVMKALEKDRSRRYESASALALDIQRYLDDERVQACPASTGYRINKMVRRNRSLLAALAAIFLAMVTGTIIATWQAITAMRAQALATSRLVVADNARLNERKARDKAEKLTQESRRLLSKRYVTSAADLIGRNDLMQSLSWYVEALKVESGDPKLENIHRTSISMVLTQCPKLVAMFDTNFPRDSLAFLVSSYDVMRFDSQNRPMALQVDQEIAQVYDVTTGQPLGRKFRAPRHSEGYCKLSPLGRFVLAEGGGNWSLWDTSGNKIISVEGFESPRHFSFSSDDKKLVLQSVPKTVMCWDTDTGNLIASEEFDLSGWYGYFPPLVFDKGALLFNRSQLGKWVLGSKIETLSLGFTSTSARLSHDETRVVVTGDDQVARVFSVNTLAESAPPLPHGAPLKKACFSPHDNLIVTLGGNTAKIWNSATGAPATTPLHHDSEVWDASFSKDGRYVVTVGWDSTARVWDTATGKLAYPILAHHTQVASAQFDASGRTLLTVTSDGVVHCWDLAASRPPCVLVDDGVTGFDFNLTSDGSRLLTSGSSGRFWNAESGRKVSAPMSHQGSVRLAEVNEQTRRALTIGHLPSMRVWNIDRLDAPVKLYDIDEGFINYAAFSPNGRYILTGLFPRKVQVRETESGTLLDWPASKVTGAIVSAFSKNGQFLATGHRQLGLNLRIGPGALGLWSGTTGEPIVTPIVHHGPVRSLAFSDDESKVATVSGLIDGGLGEVRLFETKTGRECGPTLRDRSEFISIDFDDAGGRLLTTSRDGSARVWDLSSGQPITPPMQHSADLCHGAFSPDGQFVLTVTDRSGAGASATARLWNAATGLLVTPPLCASHSSSKFNSSASTAWSYSRDGQRVALACGGGATHVWQISTENGSEADLERLAKLYSSRQHDELGGFSSLDASKKFELWNDLKHRHPEWFLTSKAQVLAWQYDEAVHCQRTAHYAEAIARLDELINDLPPENVGLRLRRAQCLVAVGQLEAANGELASLISEGCQGYLYYWWSGVVALKSGDIPRFRSVCSKMVQEFSHAGDPLIAERVALLIALGPDAVDDYKAVIEAAQGLRKPNSATAAVLLRAGRLEEAIERAAAAEETDTFSQARNAYLRALILHGLNRADESRQAFADGEKHSARLIEASSKTPAWDDTLALEILRSEAEMRIMVNGAADATN